MGRILAVVALILMGLVVLDQGSQVLNAAQAERINQLDSL